MIQTQQNRIKTLTGRRQPVGHLQAWPRIRTRDDREQIQQVARAGLEPGTAGLRVRRADHSARLPPNLLKSCNGYPTSNGEEYYYEVKHIPSKLKVVQTHGNQPNYGFNDKYSSKDVV